MISSSLAPGRYELRGGVPVAVGERAVHVGGERFEIVRQGGKRWLRCPCKRLAGRLHLTMDGLRCHWCRDTIAGL